MNRATAFLQMQNPPIRWSRLSRLICSSVVGDRFELRLN